MNAREVRKTFLDYFKERGHAILPSSPVVPHGDPTLLFTNAGMNQFKDIFTGKVKARVPRATTVQKCIRAGGKHNDLDNVGYTSRHLTFFEMLGNFSFGDYFKKEAVEYAWELVTEYFEISPDRLWVTVFHEDDEARKLWHEVAGVSADRIVGLGEKDNYWSMGDVGPCGPCSEILLDRGEAFGVADVENGERFFEIWNLVFMQFDQKPDGTKVPLPRPSIDTGMGLERLVMVLQDVGTLFETDILRSLMGRVEEITGVAYDAGPDGVAHRVIADHIRTLVFAFADGAEPSNEGRGYVLRRILRRAARYARKIHEDGLILHCLVEEVVRQMGEAFPEIVERQDFIERLIRNEEERFGETLDKGLQLFEETAARLSKTGSRIIPGAEVFKLYDTFGFPVDLVEQMALEKEFQVDMPGFDELMKGQRERSRGASLFNVVTSEGDGLEVDRLPETQFLGYSETRARAAIQASAEMRAGSGEHLWQIVLGETPFYAESGGQVGDTGHLDGDAFRLEVVDTQKETGRFVHTCRLLEGDPCKIASGAEVNACVDAGRRGAIQRNHTATHLLHAALRSVLGDHVRQRGSLVESPRLRFDVTHFSSIEAEELARVEEIVRGQILKDTAVECFETGHEDALARGAMALFGEKYGDVVRVVQIGDFSMELCGGTHVTRTGELGPFLISSEGSVSSGVRRLEALTGSGAQSYYGRREEILMDLSRLLKARPELLAERIDKLIAENRDLKAKLKAGGGAAASGAVERLRMGTLLFVHQVLEGADGKAVRDAYDRVKGEAPELVAAIVSKHAEKLQVLVGVSKALVEQGWDAREIFRAGAEPVSARGGGRPQMAQGGGVDAKGAVEKALELMKEAVQSRL